MTTTSVHMKTLLNHL